MINRQIFPLFWLIQLLDREQRDCDHKLRMILGLGEMPDEVRAQVEMPEDAIIYSHTDHQRLEGVLSFARQQCDQFNLERTRDRLVHFGRAMQSKPRSPRDVGGELLALMQALQDDLNFKYFYWYPDDMAKLLLHVTSDWAPAIAAFPSSESDVEAATDCAALNHPEGAIFYAMRVAEAGMRAVARERKVRLPKGKALEYAEWHAIIAEIDKKREDIARNAKAGPKKDRALAFYSGTSAHLHSFKDRYRNPVSHLRTDRPYTQEEALSALRQVRDFMNDLSAHVNETTKRSIAWRF